MKWVKGLSCLLLVFVLIPFGCDKVSRMMPGDSNQKAVKQSDDNKQGCDGNEISIATIAKGQVGAMQQEMKQVINNSEDWKALWHTYNDEDSTTPNVDFSQSFVIAVSRGQKPNGGHLVSIDRVCQDQQNISVKVLNKKPEADCPVSSAVTYPYHIVKINKAKPKDVSFHEKDIQSCTKEMHQNKQCPDLIKTTPVKKGAHSGVDKAKEIIIRNERDWQNLSDQMKGETLPRVNFQKKMIVGVFQGKKPSGGYSVYVNKVCKTDQGTEVRVVKEKPGNDCIVTQNLTSPYELVILPKLSDDLAFKKITKTIDCK